jgi:hypothetical protein
MNQTNQDLRPDDTKIIEVNIEPQYGKWVYYPVCKHAKTFAEIAGTKTLTEPTLKHILSLGYEIKTYARSLEGLVTGGTRV